jgi:hypothetical protein
MIETSYGDTKLGNRYTYIDVATTLALNTLARNLTRFQIQLKIGHGKQ